MAPAGPEVAVVIATRDREARLAFALEALERQTLERERFEVVVVRAGDEGSPETVQSPGGRTRFLVHDGRPGAAAQRNVGWRAAQAPLIAFIDDDSRPAPEWLERILDAAGGERTIVQGRIEPDPSERHLLYGLARTAEITEQSPRFETGNIAYPRALLERLDGFDESFPGSAWGEDTDLGVRALALGAVPEYVDEAVVWHAVVPRTLAGALRETSRYAWLVRVLARHPEHRRVLFPHGVIKESHVTLALALAAAIALRRPAAAIFAAPYLARSLEHHLGVNPPSARGLARFAIHLPAVLALDLAELAVTVRAAVRHRVPLI